METNIGVYRRLFVEESVHGINTVSLETWRRSNLKTAFTLLRMCFHVLVIIALKGYGGKLSDILYLLRWIFWIYCVYLTLSSIWDYKTKLSAALNLQAIASKMVNNEMDVPGRYMLNTLSLCHFVVEVLVGTVVFWSESQWNKDSWIATASVFYIKTIYFLVTFSQVTLLGLYLTDLKLILKSVKKSLLEVTESFRDTSTFRQTSSRRRSRRSHEPDQMNPGSKRKIGLLLECSGILAELELDILNTFWFQIVYFRILMEVFTPLFPIYMDFFESHSIGPGAVLTLASHWPLICSVLVVERYCKCRKEAHQQLALSLVGKGRLPHHQLLRHQLLASIHRSSAPISVELFDMDFALFATIFENYTLVLTTTLSFLVQYGMKT